MPRVSKIAQSPPHAVAQALDNPFVQARGGLVDFHYDDGRHARMMANPIRVTGVDLPARAAPRMGQHNEALLREAGFDDAAIAKGGPLATSKRPSARAVVPHRSA